MKATQLHYPYRDSSIRSFGQWIVNYDWNQALVGLTTTQQLNIFLTATTNKYHHHFPLISRKQQKWDKPWMTQNIIKLDGQRQQAFAHKDREPYAWRQLHNKVQHGIKDAKAEFCRTSVDSLKRKQPAHWLREIQSLCHLKPKAGSIPRPPGNR